MNKNACHSQVRDCEICRLSRRVDGGGHFDATDLCATARWPANRRAADPVGRDRQEICSTACQELRSE